MSMKDYALKFDKFIKAFNKAVDDSDNRLSDGKVNWNFVDADLCLDGWDVLFGDKFYQIFDEMAEDYILNDAGEKLEVLKREYLGQ
tara:strand:+ start:2235 stop:2492 length:258 start_codon:yes stop_codon:yes gene_type:complete